MHSPLRPPQQLPTQLFSEYFCNLRNDLNPPQVPCVYSEAVVNLLSVWTHLFWPIGIEYNMWIFVPSIYPLFSVFIHCYMYQYLIHFSCCMKFHSMNSPHFTYSFIVWATFGCFYSLMVMNKSLLNIHVYILGIHTFSFLLAKSHSGVTRSYANSVFNFLKFCLFSKVAWPFHIPTCSF